MAMMCDFKGMEGSHRKCFFGFDYDEDESDGVGSLQFFTPTSTSGRASPATVLHTSSYSLPPCTLNCAKPSTYYNYPPSPCATSHALCTEYPQRS